MATTRLKLFARHVLEGASASSQGADAVQELVITAYNAMADAAWTRDDSPPTMPVHEYDRARPHGDAYNATWGYEAETRSERSCCGAVCYTYKIPADAIDQTTHGPCSLQSVAVRIRGDRYLNSGAIVAAMQSDDPEPPAWAAVLAAVTSSDPVCATSDQLDPETGEPLPPNQRAGETADVSIAFSATPLGYVHVVLRCADYLEHRGAWIEGGALVVNSAASAQFSRDVAEDADADVLYALPMDIGDDATGGFVSLASSFTYRASFSGIGESSLDKMRNAFAGLVAPPEMYVLGYKQLHFYDVTYISLCDDGAACCVAVSSGLTMGGVFDRVRFGSGIVMHCDARIVAYGVAEPPIDAGGKPLRMRMQPWSVVSPDFAAGTATAIDVVDNDGSQQETIHVPVVPLAALDCVANSSLPSLEFRDRFHAGRVSSLIVAVFPRPVSGIRAINAWRPAIIDFSSLRFGIQLDVTQSALNVDILTTPPAGAPAGMQNYYVFSNKYNISAGYDQAYWISNYNHVYFSLPWYKGAEERDVNVHQGPLDNYYPSATIRLGGDIVWKQQGGDAFETCTCEIRSNLPNFLGVYDTGIMVHELMSLRLNFSGINRVNMTLNARDVYDRRNGAGTLALTSESMTAQPNISRPDGVFVYDPLQMQPMTLERTKTE